MASRRDPRQEEDGPNVVAYGRYVFRDDWNIDDSANENEYIRRIGFHHFPEDPELLCGELLHALGADQEEAA
jgi:hypothetical protein